MSGIGTPGSFPGSSEVEQTAFGLPDHLGGARGLRAGLFNGLTDGKHPDSELSARSGRCSLFGAVQLDLPRTSLDA
jgi:hypothetical protein